MGRVDQVSADAQDEGIGTGVGFIEELPARVDLGAAWAIADHAITGLTFRPRIGVDKIIIQITAEIGDE